MAHPSHLGASPERERPTLAAWRCALAALAALASLTLGACGDDPKPTGQTDVVALDAALADTPPVDAGCATASTCPASTVPCEVAVCSPQGTCTTGPAPEGTTCDDGEPCTQGDTCEAGSCSPGALTCACLTTADCAAQEDGDLCNGTLFCDKSGAQPACSVNPATVQKCVANGDLCAPNLCDPNDGACKVTPTPDGTTCDDGNACTQDDACQQGVCAGTPDAACACQADKDCAGFEDGDLCNGTLYCDTATFPYTCKVNPGTVVTCPKGGGACTPYTCKPNDGLCHPVALPEGATCDADGFPCTDDSCKAGSCEQGQLEGKCACNIDADCMQYDNGDVCDGTLYCNLAQKTCAVNPATVVVCPTVDNTACRERTCNPSTGACLLVNLPAKLPCEDGYTCSKDDACDGKGSCVPGSNTCQCTDSPQCAKFGSTNKCAATLYCEKPSGVCKGNPATVPVCDSVADTTCLTNTCDPKDGACKMSPTHEGQACEADGSVCTTIDTCKQGKCVPASNTCPCKSDSDCADKDDGDACNGTLFCNKVSKACEINPASVVACKGNGSVCLPNQCDPKDGTCKATAAKDGTKCETDDFFCTQERCQGGKCEVSTPENTCLCWEDGDCAAITLSNLCVGKLYCDKSANAGKQPVCQLNKGTAVTCSAGDGKSCDLPACDPATGKCTATKKAPDGVVCDDGDLCTKQDLCAKGLCAGTPEQAGLCDDKIFCTTDSCDPKVGCVHATTHSACDDGNPCTTGSCDAKLGCAHLPNSATCTDGDACTASDACAKGACVPGQAVDCDDDNPCTTDSCDPKAAAGKSCQHANNTATCSDGSACTQQDACDGAGACKGGTATDCDDGDPCTTDTCDAKKGCVATANSAACDDGSACTDKDACLAGACVGTAVSCDDGDGCTKDACDPKAAAGKGCTNTPLNAGPCNDGSTCTTSDACKAGKCVGTPVTCADKGDCKASGCDAKLGCQYTGKAEVCNGVDDDCDSVKDNGCDDDGDGFCDSKMAVAAGATCSGSLGWQGACTPAHPAATFSFAKSRTVTLTKPYTGFGYGGYHRFHDEFLMLAIVVGQTGKTSTVWRFDPLGHRLGRRVVPAPTVLVADGDDTGPDLFLGSASAGAVRVDGSDKVVWTHTASGTQAAQLSSDGTAVWVAFGSAAPTLTRLSRAKGDKLGTVTLAYAQSGAGAFTSHRGLAAGGGKLWHVGGTGALARYSDQGALEATVTHAANDAFQAVFTGRELCLLQPPSLTASTKTLTCYLIKPPTCTTAGDDCDDTAKAKHPAAVEVCDGQDDDCDGKADQDCDRDGDGYCAAHKTVAATATCAKSKLACPTGGVVSGGHCYWSPKGESDKLTWPAAKAACAQLGAHLVTVADAAENDVVATAVAQSRIVSNNVWLGLAPAVGSSGKHTWVDGSPLGYTNWSGTPNPTRAGAFFRINKTWISQISTNPFPYVCEREPALDCADVEASAFPGATEVCDGVDDNCDAAVDDGCDVDQDTFCAKGRKVLPGALCAGSTGDQSGCARSVCSGNTGNAHCGLSRYDLPASDQLTGAIYGMHHRFRGELWLTRPEGGGWKVARYLGDPAAPKAGQTTKLAEIGRFDISSYPNVKGIAGHPTQDRWVLCHGTKGGAPITLLSGVNTASVVGVVTTAGACLKIHTAGAEAYAVLSQDPKQIRRYDLASGQAKGVVTLATTGSTPIALGSWSGGWLLSNKAQQLGVYGLTGALSHTLALSSHSNQGFQWGDKVCMQRAGQTYGLECFNALVPDCSAAGDDCDDSDAQVHPGPETVCDGKDSSCDGLTDEGCDPDGDGFCTATRVVSEGALCAMSYPAPCKGGVTLGGACYKAYPRTSAYSKTFAQAVAFCAGQGGHLATIGSAEENAAVWAAIGKQGPLTTSGFWRIGLEDPDADKAYTWLDGTPLSYTNWESGNPSAPKLAGYLETGSGRTGKWSTGSLNFPMYLVCELRVKRDCDETNPGVNPDATELCDGKDNSCAGKADAGCDEDGDGYCAPGKTPLAGSICAKAGDCDDANKDTNPNATELCDGKDNDCDATADNGCDPDGDGYCAKGKTVLQGAKCAKTAPPTCVIAGGRCFRDSGSVLTGNQAKLLCNFAGNGQTTAVITSPEDNAAAQAVLQAKGATDGYLGLTDLGTDGTYVWGATQKVATWLNFAADGQVAGSKGYVSMTTATGKWKEDDGGAKYYAVCQSALAFDCDETSAAINPGAFAEICDGKDNNCNGETDEGCDDDKDGYCDKDRGVLPGALCTNSFGPKGKCAGNVAKSDVSKITPTRQVKLKDANGAVYTAQGAALRHEGRNEWWGIVGSTWTRFKDDGTFISTFDGSHLTTKWAAAHSEDAVFVATTTELRRYEGLSTSAKWTKDVSATHTGRVSVDAGKVWMQLKNKNELGCFDPKTGVACAQTYPIQLGAGHDLSTAVVHLNQVLLYAGNLVMARYDLISGKAAGTFKISGQKTISQLHTTAAEVCTLETNSGLAPRCYGAGRPACATGGDDCNDHAKDTHPATPEVCNGKDENCDGVADDGCDDDKDGFCDAGSTVVPGALCSKSFSEGGCDEHVAAPPGQVRFAFMAGMGVSARAKWHAFRSEWWVKNGNNWSRHAPDGKLLGTFVGNHLINEGSWNASHDEDAVFVHLNKTLRKYSGTSATAVWTKTDNDFEGVPSYDEGKVWLKRAGQNSFLSVDPKTGAKDSKLYPITLTSGHKLIAGVVHLGKVWIFYSFYKAFRYDLATGKYELELGVPGKFNSHFSTSDTEICVGDAGAGHVGRCWVVAVSTCPGGKGDDCDDDDATVKPVAADTLCDGKDDNCDGATDEGCDGDGDGFCGGGKPVLQGALCSKSFGSGGKCGGLKPFNTPVATRQVFLVGPATASGNGTGTGGPHPFRKEWWSHAGSTWSRHGADGAHIANFAGSHLSDVWSASATEDAVFTLKAGKLYRFDGLGSTPKWSFDTSGQVEGQIAASGERLWLKLKGVSKITSVAAADGEGGGGDVTVQLLAGHDLNAFAVSLGKLYLRAGAGKAHRYDLATGKAELTVPHTTQTVARYTTLGDELCAHESGKGMRPHCVRVAEPYCAQQGDDCQDSDKSKFPGSKEQCDNTDDNCDGEVDDGCDDDKDGFCDQDHAVVDTTVCAKSLPTICQGGVVHEGHCYRAFDKPTKTWANARVECQKDGGDLATAVDAAERAVVEAAAEKALPGANAYWLLGASAPAGTKSYAWVDGSPFAVTHWRSAEPKNVGGVLAFQGGPIGKNEWITLSTGGLGARVCKYALLTDCDDDNDGRKPGVTEQVCDGQDDNCDGATDEGCDDDKDGFCDQSMNVAPGAKCAGTQSNLLGRCDSWQWAASTPAAEDIGTPSQKGRSLEQVGAAHAGWHGYHNEWWVVRAETATQAGQLTRVSPKGVTLGVVALPGVAMGKALVGHTKEDSWFVTLADYVERRNGVSGERAVQTAKLAGARALSVDAAGSLWVHKHGTRQFWVVDPGTGVTLKTLTLAAAQGVGAAISGAAIGDRVFLAFADKSAGDKLLQWRGYHIFGDDVGKSNGAAFAHSTTQPAHAIGGPGLLCHGWSGSALTACLRVATAACVLGDDCDDANAGVKPGAVELCDGTDSNCDGKTSDCDDDDLCTHNDQCNSANCEASPGCNDDNPCTLDSCVKTAGVAIAKGCQYANANNGTSCDDDKPCTSSTTCQAGSCKGTASNSPCGGVGTCQASGECGCGVDGYFDASTGNCEICRCDEGAAITVSGIASKRTALNAGTTSNAHSLAYEGGVLVLGASVHKTGGGGPETGGVRVLVRTPAGGFAPLGAVITPQIPTGGARFGEAIALVPGRLAVGEPEQNTVHIYKPNNTNGQFAIEHTLSSATGTPKFGSALATCDQRLYIGAPALTVGGKAQAGSVFVSFQKQDGSYDTPVALSIQPSAQASLGAPRTLACQNARLFAGAPGESGHGAVWVLLPGSNTAHTIIQKVEPPETGYTGAQFGMVAISAGRLLVGAPGFSSQKGVALAYAVNGQGQFKLVNTLSRSAHLAGERVGHAVAVAGDTALLGVPGRTIGTQTAAGAVELWRWSGTTWTYTTELTAATTSAGNEYGAGLGFIGADPGVGNKASGTGDPFDWYRTGTGCSAGVCECLPGFTGKQCQQALQ